METITKTAKHPSILSFGLTGLVILPLILFISRDMEVVRSYIRHVNGLV